MWVMFAPCFHTCHAGLPALLRPPCSEYSEIHLSITVVTDTMRTIVWGSGDRNHPRHDIETKFLTKGVER
jgi:hypothetical protein